MSPLVSHQVSSEELDNCARELIHQTPLLQPHGFLIACDVHTGLIVFASDNATQFLPAGPGGLLGRPIDEVVDGPFEDAWERVRSMHPGAPIALALRLRSCSPALECSEVIVHRAGDNVVIEAMPYRCAVSDVDIYIEFERVLGELGRLQRHVRTSDFLQACASEIRRLSGYERVVIYRFLPDWCGEVLAESCDEGIEVRFLGLRFPASDIPEQARALYKINLLRIIGDVQAQPGSMQSMQPDARLDLSHSLLRQPSSMHLKYLENMGVRATMTISLLKDGELWGMVSCHHSQPRTPPLQLRRMTKMLCSLVAEVAVVRLDVLVRQEAQARALAFSQLPKQLGLHFSTGHDFADAARKCLAELAGLMKAQAYGLMVAGTWVCEPHVDPAIAEFLILQARVLPVGEDIVTHNLPMLAGVATGQWHPWSGAMVMPIADVPESYLVFLRQSVELEVHWAGAPAKLSAQLPNGLHVLGPRASFDRWTQHSNGRSEPWDDSDRHAARAMVNAISELHRADRTRKMQAELHLLGSYMEHLNDMVVVTTTNTIDAPGPEIVYVNQAFVTRTGYSREEVLGKSPRILQGPETQRSQLDALRAAMLAWQPITVEIINYTKTGEKFWVEISLTAIANASGWYTHWVAIERDITERKRAESEIQMLANYDPLTGLPNRRMLMDRLQLALRTSQRYKRNGALLFIDLDNFKDLNDTAGHFLGDALLKQAAQRLVAEVRVQDVVARLGGDEFVVMLEDLSPADVDAATAAQQVAQKIVLAMRQAYDLDGQTYNSTASVGVSLFVSDGDFGTVEALLKQSDFAMYQAKGAGRNTWRFYDPATQAALVARNAIETDLKVALAQKQLEAHYQIIVDSQCKVTGVEVLLRWPHPVRGLVSPVEFIPIAEHSGLILSIGQWVLQTACDLLATWANSPERCHWSMAVNVSARQVSQAGFVEMVTGQVEKSGCNPALLKLELTESLLQHDFDATVAKMDALRALGVQFSIDDFGTGYSSLAYLRRLPVSVLKIDRSFVRDIEQDEGDRAICKTVIALGQTLNMSIVAEGVETQAQFDFLEANGCDRFQGYLFGKPVPLAQLQAPARSGLASLG
jgi:diguanylate cyclase (GGDEF)-like protein/PAS domain S-box-containing protein